MAEAYGTTVEGLLGRTDADFNAQAEEVAAFLRDDLEVLDSLQEKLIPEEIITDVTGARLWLQTVKRPIIGADGKADQVLGVSTDITAHRSAEEQLRQAQKLEALGRLAGGVAHDFNNMLNVILGYASLVLPRLPDVELRSKLQEIVKAGERAASLTRQLLAFSRKQILQGKVLDLNAVIGDTGKMLGRLIGEDIELAMVLRKELGRVMADAGQIEQVIMNLALNAKDSMPRGGRLTVETANVELDQSYATEHTEARPGQYVLLAVTDTGVGMDGETQRHIFEPFFTTKAMGRGTGLGLATVYGIVKQSGGAV